MPWSECLRSLQGPTAHASWQNTNCSCCMDHAAASEDCWPADEGQPARIRNPLILGRVTNLDVGAVAPGAACCRGPLITESMSPSSQRQTNTRVAVAQMTSTGG